MSHNVDVTPSVADVLTALGTLSDNAVWTGALNTLGNFARTAGFGNVTLTVSVDDPPLPPDPVASLRTKLEDLFGDTGPMGELKTILGTVTTDLQSLSGIPGKIEQLLAIVTGFLESTSRLAPALPVEVLRDVAEGIKKVEQSLNPENLVISSGKVVVTMTVGNKAIAQADTTFTFDIQPKPIS